MTPQALENADLHRRQRLAIDRLEHKNRETAEQTAKLKRVLLAHEALATAVVEDRGLASVASSLATFSGGEVAIVAPHDRILAMSPASARIDWRPPGQVGISHAIVEEAGDAHLMAAPAVVESEPWAWVIAALRRPPDDVDKSAIEYAAMLTTLELLRERTADEV